MSRKPALRIPDWVPDAARRQITDLWAQPWTDDAGRELLDRLATSEAMKTGVWKKLPSEPKNFEGKIIYWAFNAITGFPRLRRCFPKRKSKQLEYAKHLMKHPPFPDPSHASSLADLLREQMLEQKYNAEDYWGRFWEGGNLTHDQVIDIIGHVSSFYRKLDEDWRLVLRSLPDVKRWSGSKPAQQFFTSFLSQRMTETYGHPFDPIVATLVEVAFDLAEGVDTETIRGRRRKPDTPENSR